MSKKCYVIGVFPPPYGGVTVKCNLFCNALREQNYEVNSIDVYEIKRNKKKIIEILFKCIRAFKSGTPIVYCLDTKRLIALLNIQRIFKGSFENTTVLAVGGRFQDIVVQHRSLMSNLRRVKGIWVETNGMKDKMITLGLSNVSVFPNPKSLIGACFPQYNENKAKLKIVYFSQISTQKGVEDIFDTVRLLQDKSVDYDIDFYGHVMPEILESFKSFIAEHYNVNYCGVFDSTKKSVYQQLNQYDILLFPTHWDTEGVPGIIVEAKMAGLAVLASDRSYNSELVDEKNNEGILLHNNYSLEMADAIERLYYDRKYLSKIKNASYASRVRFSLEEYYSLINRI